MANSAGVADAQALAADMISNRVQAPTKRGYSSSLSDWIQVSRSRQVIRALEELIGVTAEDQALLSKSDLGRSFDDGYEKLLQKLYPGMERSRDRDKGIGTLYNRLTKK